METSVGAAITLSKTEVLEILSTHLNKTFGVDFGVADMSFDIQEQGEGESPNVDLEHIVFPVQIEMIPKFIEACQRNEESKKKEKPTIVKKKV